jgi:hypothetical protein
MIEVVDWIDYPKKGEYPENNAGGLGGWVDGESFEEYLEEYGSSVHPYLEAIRKDVVAKSLRLTGEQHQHHPNGVPLFNDGTVSLFSYRAWGDLMAAIWNSEEKTDQYQYMDFYM